jgi:hypothetical protein
MAINQPKYFTPRTLVNGAKLVEIIGKLVQRGFQRHRRILSEYVRLYASQLLEGSEPTDEELTASSLAKGNRLGVRWTSSGFCILLDARPTDGSGPEACARVGKDGY